MGLKKFGFGGIVASDAAESGPVADIDRSSSSSSSSNNNNANDGSGSSASTKLLPLHPNICFPFNVEDSNTPITGIVPLPQSHYACISSTSGQIRM
jgi:hypothetical protein